MAGCVNKADIFIAFSPEPTIQHKIDPLFTLVEEKLAQFYEDGTVAKVMAAYGLQADR